MAAFRSSASAFSSSPAIGWWGDVIKESRAGDHTPVVDIGLRYGMILFIASEVMFFVAWFWMFFELAIFHEHRAAWIVPTWDEATTAGLGQLAAAARRDVRSLPPAADEHAHPAALGHDGDLGAPRAAAGRPQRRAPGPHPHRAARACCSPGSSSASNIPKPASPSATRARPRIANVYGSSFFMATGFHGAHVIIGTIFLAVCLLRLLAGQFTPKKHFGLEAAAWYWHFVDVVWLFLFTFVYVTAVPDDADAIDGDGAQRPVRRGLAGPPAPLPAMRRGRGVSGLSEIPRPLPRLRRRLQGRRRRRRAGRVRDPHRRRHRRAAARSSCSSASTCRAGSRSRSP